MAEPEVESGAETPVGAYLRGIREAKGLQLDDASRVTKIGKNYLVAIEAGEFEKLPNAAYIKGFLRLYAGFLSLSGDEVVARYEKGLAPPPGPKSETGVPHPKGSGAHTGIDTLERTRFRSYGRWVIPALLLVLVVIAALFFSEGEQPRVQPPPTAPVPAAPPAPAPVAQPVQKQLSSARGETPPLPGGAETSPAPGGKQSGIVLRLRFNQDSWLSITIDDSISQRYDLKAGDIIEWKGQRSFALDLGDGGAVEAEFNGRPLNALGEPGKPAHVELKGNQPGAVAP